MTHPFLSRAPRAGLAAWAASSWRRCSGLPVRAMVRREDERAEALRATGAEVIVAAKA